jgi:hypothetical protein
VCDARADGQDLGGPFAAKGVLAKSQFRIVARADREKDFNQNIPAGA